MAHFCCFTLGGNLDFSRFPVKSFTTLATGRSIGKTDIKGDDKVCKQCNANYESGFLDKLHNLAPTETMIKKSTKACKA